MMDDDGTRRKGPDPDATREEFGALVDSLRQRFESAFSLREEPRIEDYLQEVPEPMRPRLLRELLTIERKELQESGRPYSASDYYERFEAYQEVVASVWGDIPAEDDATRDRETTLKVTGKTGSARTDGQLPPAARQRYRLTTLHATGGIGRIWLAHDRKLGRDVALKEMRPERSASAIDARFLAEARITGKLEHPNIVPVYDVGDEGESPRPFYTMRFVKGRTLKETIDAFHQRRKESGATPGDLLQLIGALINVANAVAYAHSRGVLHRDLKGSNVALGDFGEVFLLDWGLAKQLDDQTVDDGPASAAPGRRALDVHATQEGDLIGTPAFMAPEQAEGRQADVEPRTDVYSLGAILYEILTGGPPFRGTDSMDILRRVRQVPPERPRSVWKEAPRALEAICLKALEKEPERRYASAQDFARDLQRWSADEPVEAYPEPWSTRLWRWSRRHRTGVAAAVLVLLTATTALGATTVLVTRESRRTSRALERAELNFQHASDAVDAMLTRVGSERLQDIPQMESLRRELLSEALAFHERFLEQRGDDPQVRTQAARAFERMGHIQLLLGDTVAAEESYNGARDLYLELSQAEQPPPEVLLELANVQRALGSIDGDLGRMEEAEAAFRLAIEFRRRIPPSQRDSHFHGELGRDMQGLGSLLAHQRKLDESLEVLEESLRQFALADDTEPARAGRGRGLGALGLLLLDLQKPSEAEVALLESVDILKELLEDHPDSAMYRELLAGAYSNLSYVYYPNPDRQDEFREALENCVEERQRLVDEFPLVPTYLNFLGSSLNSLAVSYARRGQEVEAEPYFRRALEVHARLAATYPDVPDYRAELALDWNNLAVLLGNQRRAEESLDALREALAIRRELAERFPDLAHTAALATSLGAVGSQSLAFGFPEEAVGYLEEAAELYRQLDLPRDRHKHAQCLRDYGTVLVRLGRPGEGETALRESLALSQGLVESSPDNPEYRRQRALAFENLADLLRDRHRFAEALESMAAAMELLEPLLTSFPNRYEYAQEYARLLQSRGAILEAAGSNREALESFEEAAERFTALRAHFPDRHDHTREEVTATLQWCTAALDRENVDGDSAELAAISDRCVHALQAIETVVEQADNLRFRRVLARALVVHGRILLRQGNRSLGVEHLERGRSLFAELREEDPDDVRLVSGWAEAGSWLGVAATLEGDEASAEQLWATGIAEQQAALTAARAPDWNSRRRLREHAGMLGDHYVAQGDYASAAELAESVGDLPSPDWEEALTAARMLVRCCEGLARSSSIDDEPGSTEDSRDDRELLEACGGAAVGWLAVALERGWDGESLASHSEWDPLREREDFREVVDAQEVD